VKPGAPARRALLLALAAAIWILSDQPSLQVLPPLFPGQDKIYHLVEFAGLGAALWMNRDLSGGKALPLIAAGVLWGGIDEIHQSWVPGRDCSLLDFLADSAGVLIWMYAASLHRRRKLRAAALDSGSRSGI
jgi:VanZ family protein